MAGFCLTLLIGCTTSTACPSPELSAFQQSLRTADREILEQTTKVVSGISENTVALSEIKEKIDGIAAQLEAAQVQSKSEPGEEAIKSEDTSADKTANDSQTATRSVAESAEVPLFVSVTRFCQPCNMVKRDFLKGKLKGFRVTFCTQTEQHRDELIAEGIPAENVIVQDIPVANGFPAIRYPSAESVTGWRWHNTPSYGPRVLMELRATLLGERTPVEYPQTFVEPMPSHGDLVSLHNSLHGGGQWTWPGDLATHLSQSHGVNLNGTVANHQVNPVVRARSVVSTVSRGPLVNWRSRSVLRSHCPDGRCPRN